MTLDPDSLAIEDRAFTDRACRYLDGTMTEVEFAEFQEELRGNRDRQQLLMQLSAQQVLLVQCGEGMLSDEEPQSVWRLDRKRLRVASIAAIAAALMLAVGVRLAAGNVQIPSFQLKRVAAAKFIGTPSGAERLTKIQLSQGVAEFQLDNGTRLVASDRCRAQLLASSVISLEFGTLVVEVPPEAAGVRIETPQAAFRDVGTRFVINATPQKSELHVLDGEVAVLPKWSDDLDEAKAVIGKRQALMVRGVEGSGGVVRTQFDPSKYVLEVPTEISIPVVNTGLRHRLGDSDGNWAIVELPTDIGGNLQRAAIITHNVYEPNDAATSQWISMAHPLPVQPVNSRYQFRTAFELNGCRPDSARLEGRFWVDNFVTAIRLNGVEQPLPDQLSSGLNHRPGAATKFVITSGFRHGFNLLEFDVVNRIGESSPNYNNPLAFRCELAGTVAVAQDPLEAAAADPDNQPLQ